MKFELPKLDYDYSSLEPHIDSKTMEIHHTKHHQTYIDKLNLSLENYPLLQKKKIESLLSEIDLMPAEIKISLRNNGGGHANHSFFWKSMTPDKKRREFKGELIKGIEKSMGGFDKFKEKFISEALTRFGSGWVWLVLNGKNLEIYSTANQDSPLMEKKIPLLGLDVWEHAYYLKWQSNRKGYAEEWFKLIDWLRADEIYLSNLKNKTV